MATNRLHLNLDGLPKLGAAALAALLVAFAAPSIAQAYGWPVKPFDRQHPVRGFFGDPRFAHPCAPGSFHFGVDVSAPDHTPVYTTLTGTVMLDPANPDAVFVRSATDPALLFAYWHLVPTIRAGQRVTAYRTVVGRIARGWEHVHFAEQRAGRYLNPLRRGAMAPFGDWTRPAVRTLSIERDGTAVRRAVPGGVDLVAEVRDGTPLPIAGRWHARPVMPALVRWRLRSPRRNGEWRTAADFRNVIPPDDAFGTVYARWTRQNKPPRDGRYRIVLACNVDVADFAPGTNRVDVEATDTRGNTARRSFVVTAGPGRVLQVAR